MASTRAWPVLVLVGAAGVVARVAEFWASPTDDPLTVLVGSLIPIGFALTLLGLVWWIRYDERTTITRRTIGWCLLGGSVIAGIEGTTVLYQQTQGVVLTERRLTVMNAFVRGTLLGLLIGLYDHQRRAAIRSSRERESQRDRLAEFASVVAHDLRNPLSVAQGYLLLAREGDESAFDRVESALERADRIIDDTLTLAREGEAATETESISLAATARDAWSTTEAAEGTATAEVSLRIDSDVILNADASRLRRLLENLFRNAIEHGGVDGSVTVSVGALAGGDGFYVADDGPGIPEADRESVLDAGYSTETDGTGFGLAIVSRIADAHGWTVAIDEGDEGGARFTVGPR